MIQISPNEEEMSEIPINEDYAKNPSNISSRRKFY